MKTQDIQKTIDRAVGTEGILRIPSWWMHKILSDLAKFAKGNAESCDKKVGRITLYPYRKGYDEDIAFTANAIKEWRESNDIREVYIPHNYAYGAPYYEGYSIGAYTFDEACGVGFSQGIFVVEYNGYKSARIINYLIEGNKLIQKSSMGLGEPPRFHPKDFFIDESGYISLVNKVRFVQEFPEYPEEGVIYLLPSSNGEGNNTLTEWVYINGAWEQFGEFKADVDLSGYVEKEEGKGLSTEDFTTALKNRLEEIIAFLNGIEDSESLDSIIASIEQQIASVRQSIPTKVSELDNDVPYLTEHQDLSGYVKKEEGKGLSTEDFTTEDKEKLDSLENYDDTEIKNQLTELSGELSNKQDAISDLDDIRAGASKGATALQVVPEGYVTSEELSAAVSNKVSAAEVQAMINEAVTTALNTEV